MLAKNLISEIIPAINPNDKAAEALNWMDVFRVSHLPIVKNNTYIGLISDADIFDMNEPSISVIEHQRSLARPFVFENQHIYETIDEVTSNKLSLIPVLTEKEIYVGVIRSADLAHQFLQLISSNSHGGIIILELNTNDYSMSEIAQIIESNDAKILSSFISTPRNNETMNVTIKVNKTDLAAIVQTFERYNYNISAIYSSNNELDVMMQERVDAFLKYMDI